MKKFHIMIIVTWMYEIYSVGAKSQNLSSVAPPRKKNLATIFRQGHVLGPGKPLFY